MAKLDLSVGLVEEDGNVFNLIAIVSKAMKRNGYRDQVQEFQKDIMSSSSYDEALQRIMSWIEVE